MAGYSYGQPQGSPQTSNPMYQAAPLNPSQPHLMSPPSNGGQQNYGYNGGSPAHEVYDEGERSPLTAHPQPISGYPHQGSFNGPAAASNAALHQHGDNNSAFYPPNHSSNNVYTPYSEAGASDGGYIKEDPYAQQTNYAGVGGFSRPQFSHQASVGGNSDAEWQRRAQPLTRGKTTKVKLTKGNWVQEYRVPGPILNAVEKKWSSGSKTNEFTHMRYTAATVDPDDFTPEAGYTLRQKEYGRDTELLIAITYYNEDKTLVARTLHGVMMNVRDIVKSKSKFWRRTAEEGRPGWQRIVVALIFDGIDPCDKHVLDVLSTIGIYQDNIMKKDVFGKETVAHLFEYTTQLSVDTEPKLIAPQADNESGNLVPTQFIFCLKQKNSKKINSHRWLFNAIGMQLNPEVCILIDAGTKPGPKSLYHLWEAFYNDSNLGGACGEIYAQLKSGKKLINPLVAAQNFEYKMSNILDKPLESAFGYVSVLPGAFSAYRFKALLGRPLQQYFHGDHTLAARLGNKGVNGMSLFVKNMYLAEDRILCFEIVAKAKDKWHLSYVKPAKGETDVPDGVAELIGQRRRWLNGSFAASVYALVHFFRFYKSGHNPFRLLMFHVQALFNFFQLFFSWFALANLWLTFSIIIRLVASGESPTYFFYSEEVTHWVNSSLVWLYGATVALQFILALGNRPKGEVWSYVFSFVVFAILGYYLMFCAIWLTVKAFGQISFKDAPSIADKVKVLLSGTNGVLLAALMSTFGCYLLGSLLYFDVLHLLHSFPQYIGLAPSFINILMVYSFCNLHDVSWGTKGSDKADALPSVTAKTSKDEKGDQTIEELVKSQEDLDAMFKETVQRAMMPIQKTEVVEKPTQDDGNKTFRTRLVAFWLFCNGALVISIQNANGLDTSVREQNEKTSTYFEIILWATAGLSAVRFLGAFWFWICRQSCRWFRKN